MPSACRRPGRRFGATSRATPEAARSRDRTSARRRRVERFVPRRSLQMRRDDVDHRHGVPSTVTASVRTVPGWRVRLHLARLAIRPRPSCVRASPALKRVDVALSWASWRTRTRAPVRSSVTRCESQRCWRARSRPWPALRWSRLGRAADARQDYPFMALSAVGPKERSSMLETLNTQGDRPSRGRRKPAPRCDASTDPTPLNLGQRVVATMPRYTVLATHRREHLWTAIGRETTT